MLVQLSADRAAFTKGLIAIPHGARAGKPIRLERGHDAWPEPCIAPRKHRHMPDRTKPVLIRVDDPDLCMIAIDWGKLLHA